MGNFRQFLTDLSARDMSVYAFLDNNFSTYQWIFTKLGMEICFKIVSGQIVKF